MILPFMDILLAIEDNELTTDTVQYNSQLLQDSHQEKWELINFIKDYYPRDKFKSQREISDNNLKIIAESVEDRPEYQQFLINYMTYFIETEGLADKDNLAKVFSPIIPSATSWISLIDALDKANLDPVYNILYYQLLILIILNSSIDDYNTYYKYIMKAYKYTRSIDVPEKIRISLSREQ